MFRTLAATFCFLLASCSGVSSHAGDPPPLSAAPLTRDAKASPRIVAIGDLHGDLAATRRALRLAGAISGDDHWTGGAMTVVQTGDTIDRGDEDREVLDLLERLRAEAPRAGGAFIALSGNHEVMNVAADLRYVTPRSAAAFDVGRAQAFAPGAEYAQRLAHWPVVHQIGETVFVHGGVLAHHVRYGIAKLNQETAAWMRGQSPVPALLTQEDAPIWTRVYSAPGQPAACVELGQVLNMLGAKRMVVGHSVQPGGINAACDGRVWRIDTGLSRYYGGPIQVLELSDGSAPRVLAEAGAQGAQARP
jgi:hypothetical protein